jgi:outer membrane protein
MLETRFGCSGIGGVVLLAMLVMIIPLQGCTQLDYRPELYPDRWAPHDEDREWTPPSATVGSNAGVITQPVLPTEIQREREYDLPALVDIGLANNPATQRAWSTARLAAAQFGSAQAPYYPQIGFNSDTGYERILFQLPGSYGVIKQWQADPLLAMTWTLLDFGRRESASESARQRLFAANLVFNRSIQDVVFNVEAAFYSLDAAKGAVIAAQQNLRLAQTDFDAVNQRVNLGLATEPELLLAKETVAQSRFDLANAKLMVHDAEAQMAIALGVSADPPVRIIGLESQAMPQKLNRSIEELIEQARRQRPDLAARVASLRASEADVRYARSQFFPVVGLSSGYGENLWDFTFKGPPTVKLGQPTYSALLTLKWDLFTGFKRLNDMRAAEDSRDTASADLKSAEIEVIAEMWRAYYELESSRSKYEYAVSLLEATQESYEANFETYQQGLSTIVELLTAERDLPNARYTFISSKAQLLTSYAAVIYAAGAVRSR